MSEKQSETAANPETDCGQERPHSEIPSEIPAEFQPRDAGHSQHEAADAPDRKSRGIDHLSGESRQVKPNPAPEASASDSHSDGQSTIREPSDGDKMRDSAQNPEGSMVPESRSVGKGPVPDVRRERDPVGDVRGGKTAYFVVHENRASVNVHCESGDVISERNPTPSGQSTTHGPLEKNPGRPAAVKEQGGTRCLGDDGLVTTSSSDPEQGYSSDSLLLPDARKKGRSHAQPAPVDKGRRSTVWYIPLAPQGRDIFEAGGEESHNPKLKPLCGVVQEGSDRIERLPAESSVEESPVVETTPVATSVATSRSWSDSLDEALYDSLNACCCCLCRWVGSQFAKAPLFYALSVTVVIFALVAFQEDTDILACLLATVAACVILTIFVPRGMWSKGGDRLEGVDFFSWRPSGLCGECCGRLENTPQPRRRHSKYYHPLEEEAHTAFEHEVADVSNIDPKDCPQMKMVEEEILKSESPDYPPDFRQLNVDIHAPGSPRSSKEVEEAVPRKQGATKKLAKTRTRNKSKSSSALLKLSKDSKAEEVPIPHTGGQPEDLSNADLTRNVPDAPMSSFTLKSTLTSLIAETAAYNVTEFVCEHDGQGVACSCFADRWK